AVEVRQNQFGRDADALVERVREALAASTTQPAWRRKAVASAGIAAAVICVGWLGVSWIWGPPGSATPPVLNTRDSGTGSLPAIISTFTSKGSEAEQSLNTATRKVDTPTTSDQEAMRKAQEAEKQRVAALKAEEERKAKAIAEANAKRK